MRNPTAPIENARPICSGRELELADEVEDEDREHDVREEVRGPGRGGDAAQEAVRPDVAEALGDLGPHRRTLAMPIDLWLRGRLVATDREQEQRRHDEADRVEDDRERRGDRADEHAGDAGPGDLGGRVAGLSFELPSTIWSRSTSDGRYDW